MTEAVEVTKSLDLVMPDGLTYRVRPGPYGKGISVTPIVPKVQATPHTPGPRGRPPRASTVRLRKILQADADSHQLKPAKEYVDWLLRNDSTIGVQVARQVVYRERRRVQ